MYTFKFVVIQKCMNGYFRATQCVHTGEDLFLVQNSSKSTKINLDLRLVRG